MAHGFLSYQDTRGEVDYLSKIGKLLQNRQKKTGKKGPKGSGDVELKDTPEGVEPLKVEEQDQKSLPGSGPKGLLKGSVLSSIVGKDPKGALPEGKAIQPEVLGGALSRISRKPGIDAGSDVYDTTAVRVDDPAGSLSGIGELIVRSNNNVVEAVMGLQRVTVRVVDSVENLGRLQAAIADKQMQQQMLLATRAEVAAEKRALAAGSDLSGGITADEAGQGPTGRKGGGFVNLLGDGMDLMGGRYMRRGPNAKRMPGARRRLAGRTLRRAGIKGGAKSATKIGAKALGKGLLKKIPLLGLGAGLLFAGERAMAGDFTGAGLELASGAAGTIPGFGTAASVGIDAALAGRDMGLTPFANGGIITKPTAGLVGEAGKEGVFPLEGSRGKKTFLKFGEGILEAQKRNKKEYAKLQAAGLGEYFDKKPWWEQLIEGLKKILPSWMRGSDPNNPPGGPGGGRNTDVANAPDLKTAIRRAESGNDYSSMYARDRGDFARGQEDITKMTIDEVHDLQTDYLRHQASKGYGPDQRSAAMGAYQMMEVKAVAKSMGIDTSKTLFNKETQDRMSDYYLNVAGFQEYKAGKITAEQFNDRLAGQFASLQTSSGGGVYDNDGMNNAYANVLELIKARKFDSPPPAASDPDSDTSEDETPTTEPVPKDWTKGMPDYGLPADPRKSLSLGGGIYARRVKTGEGDRWKVYKTGLLGAEDIDTTGKNEWLKPKLEEAGQKYLQAQPQASASRLDPVSDTSTALATKSTEIAMANVGGGATIINNTYVTGAQPTSGGNSPGNVPIGIGSRDTGTSPFSDLSLRTIG